jgi:sugar phosphate isomerase/epimerase
MTSSVRQTAIAALLVILAITANSAFAEKPKSGGNPFFAYCLGIGVEPSFAALPAQMQLAPMLADLGYDGMALVNLDGAEELLAELEKHKQKLVAVYTGLNVDPRDQGYEPRLKSLIPKLAGHGTVLWLTVDSGQFKPSSDGGDSRAVELLRELSAIARPHGVQISLYPHLNCYAQRIEDVVRLAKKVDRPNVGVTFTFCHFLALDDAKNIDHALELTRPYLNMVTINGTDGYDAKNFSAWIKTLDEGSFDVSRVLASLRKIGYRGPIGMIVYGIRGDRRDILARSMKGWKEISAKAARAPQ